MPDDTAQTAELKKAEQLDKDANVMIGAGVGVGALGIGAALVTGAVCPLCYIVPPALVAVGAVQKAFAKKKEDAAAGAVQDTSRKEGTE